MGWVYEQSTGRLVRDGVTVATGYSGAEPNGKNVPAMQSVRNVGPIPRGWWRIGPPSWSLEHGQFCMPLAPQPGTETFGRSGFLIHGDSRSHPGAASRGCIVLPFDVRVAIRQSGDFDLQVVEGQKQQPQPEEGVA